MKSQQANSIFRNLFFRNCISVYALCAMTALPALPALGQAAGGSGGSGKGDDKTVSATDYGTVTISMKDTDLATVLEMLAIETKKNIITSKAVSATVSANLYDVTFYEALKAILDVNGYTYYEEGNFIYVITAEEAAAMEKARRRTESRIFELSYLSATDANEFIAPLLSDVGRASARGAVQPGMKPEIANAGADEYAFAPRLVVNDYPENLQAIAALLTSLDTPPQQVLVEATILQSALDEANAFGIDFSVIGSVNFLDLTNPLAAVNNLLSGGGENGHQPPDNTAQAVSSTPGNTPGPATLKVGIVQDDIAVFMRVLDEVTDTTVLARPKVMALNRQRAEVLVGVKVGYISTTSTETATTQNVQFLDTGIHLMFRPFISSDGSIRMELRPRVSEARLRDVTDANNRIITIPDELTNEVTTNVRIQDGQTIVLGGLFRDTTRTTRRQVPFLGDVPVVGAAFRGQDDKVERSEVIFLITPTIVHDQALFAAGAETLAHADAMRVGGRANLLPFSREKVTSNYNQKAQEAFNAGDHDRALYFINNSLNVAPTQPEMMHLRERITGERARAHERSLMERTLRKHLGPIEANPAPTTQGNAESSAETTESLEIAQHNADESDISVEIVDAETEEVVVADMSQGAMEDASESSADEEVEEVFVEVTPQPMPELSVNTPQQEQTLEEWLFYQGFLFNFFNSLQRPDMAAQFETTDEMKMAWESPFVTFEDMTHVVGVDTQSPQH